jgi:hypothetical protein
MSFKELAVAVAAEAKILADDVKSIANGEALTIAESYLPSLVPFLKEAASLAGNASFALAMVPYAETLINVAEVLGAHSATGDQLAELEKAHEGYSAD